MFSIPVQQCHIIQQQDYHNRDRLLGPINFQSHEIFIKNVQTSRSRATASHPNLEENGKLSAITPAGFRLAGSASHPEAWPDLFAGIMCADQTDNELFVYLGINFFCDNGHSSDERSKCGNS